MENSVYAQAALGAYRRITSNLFQHEAALTAVLIIEAANVLRIILGRLAAALRKSSP
jgi:hypothetical protein